MSDYYDFEMTIADSPEKWRGEIGKFVDMDVSGTTGRASRTALLIDVLSTGERPCILVLRAPTDDVLSMFASVAAKRED